MATFTTHLRKIKFTLCLSFKHSKKVVSPTEQHKCVSVNKILKQSVLFLSIYHLNVDKYFIACTYKWHKSLINLDIWKLYALWIMIVFFCGDKIIVHIVRMAEWSKEPDSRLNTFHTSGISGLPVEAWVQIPLLTAFFISSIPRLG